MSRRIFPPDLNILRLSIVELQDGQTEGQVDGLQYAVQPLVARSGRIMFCECSVLPQILGEPASQSPKTK